MIHPTDDESLTASRESPTKVRRETSRLDVNLYLKFKSLATKIIGLVGPTEKLLVLPFYYYFCRFCLICLWVIIRQFRLSPQRESVFYHKSAATVHDLNLSSFRRVDRLLGDKPTRRQTTGLQTTWATDVWATGWDVWATIVRTNGRHNEGPLGDKNILNKLYCIVCTSWTPISIT